MNAEQNTIDVDNVSLVLTDQFNNILYEAVKLLYFVTKGNEDEVSRIKAAASCPRDEKGDYLHPIQEMWLAVVFYEAECFQNAEIEMDFKLALEMVINAAKSLGMAQAFYIVQDDTSQFYRNAANKRHSENREMKSDAIAYYKANHGRFENKDEAAWFISQKIMPATFATVRGWLKNVQPE